VVGTPGYSYQVYVCAEGSVYIKSKSLRESIVNLIAAYFVFSIVYPKGVDVILLFFQHYVFKMKDSQRLPNAAVQLIGNLIDNCIIMLQKLILTCYEFFNTL